jgi:hypothetical protein
VSTWQPGDRPAARPDIESVDVEGELVLWDPHAQRVHRLDPVASLLWPFFDGTTSIDELAADAAEVWETTREDARDGISNLVGQLDAAGLLASEGTAGVDPSTDGADADALITNPVRCGTDLSPWPWQPSTVVEVEGRTIALRTSSPDLATALRQALRAHAVAADVPVNYSLAVGTGPGDLHLLFWGHCTVARCRTLADAVSALLLHLRGHRPPPVGAVRFDGHLLAAGGRGVLFPANERGVLWRVAARLRREGAEMVHRPWVDVDARTAAVVGGLAPLELDPAALAGALDGHHIELEAQGEGAKVVGLFVPDWMEASSPAALATTLVRQRLLADPGKGIAGFAELWPQLRVLQHRRDDLMAVTASARAALGLVDS